MSDIGWKPQSDEELAEAVKSADEITALRSKLEKAREALEWYEAKAAGCRKVTSEGNEARQALDKDGGKLAASTLKEISDE